MVAGIAALIAGKLPALPAPALAEVIRVGISLGDAVFALFIALNSSITDADADEAAIAICGYVARKTDLLQQPDLAKPIAVGWQESVPAAVAVRATGFRDVPGIGPRPGPQPQSPTDGFREDRQVPHDRRHPRFRADPVVQRCRTARFSAKARTAPNESVTWDAGLSGLDLLDHTPVERDRRLAGRRTEGPGWPWRIQGLDAQAFAKGPGHRVGQGNQRHVRPTEPEGLQRFGHPRPHQGVWAVIFGKITLEEGALG